MVGHATSWPTEGPPGQKKNLRSPSRQDWNIRVCTVFSTYPLVMTNSLLLKMAIEIVDFPIKNGGSFHCKLLVYQRVHNSLENFSSRTCQFMCWGQVTKFLGLWTKFFSAEHIRLILNMESIIYSIVDFMWISLGFYVDLWLEQKHCFWLPPGKKSTN